MFNSFYTSTVTIAAGIPYRTLDHWARSGFFRPTVEAVGTGYDRVYTYNDIVALAALMALRYAGVSTAQLAPHIAKLRKAAKKSEGVFTFVTDCVGITVDLDQVRAAVDKGLAKAPERRTRGRSAAA